MVKRKLASIQRIRDITEIKGADAIEAVHINGWACVAKKGEFKIEDKCVYFEIDSYLPIIEEFEFLRPCCYKQMPTGEEGFRLRTAKLRGQVSSGLALPFSTFSVLNENMEIGEDVTELLNVEKYEAPIPASISGDVVGAFPNFIPKTDEERIQNLPEYFSDLKGVLFEETLKLDGTSMTVFRTDEVLNEKTEEIEGISGRVGVCMRNYELRYSDSNTLWRTALKLRLPEILASEKLEVAFQGELMGNGIQGNRESLKQHEFYIFRIWDIKNQKFYSSEERECLIKDLNKKYDINLQHVPVINASIDIFNECKNMEEMLKRAEGPSIAHKIREGIVFKSTKEVNGETITFKAISNKFLLKGGD